MMVTSYAWLDAVYEVSIMHIELFIQIPGTEGSIALNSDELCRKINYYWHRGVG